MRREDDLIEALRRFATSARPLIVSDYDGTLAPIVDDPSRATAHPGALAALATLAEMRDTSVAVVSGRSLQDLRTLCAFPPAIHLVGSHGSEYESGFDDEVGPDQQRLLDQLDDELTELAAAAPGFLIERKPASVAFHYRQADPEIAEDVLTNIRQGPGAHPDVRARDGKMVVELAVIDADKGSAIERLQRESGADGVLFVGDDVTDEDAFAVLGAADIGIKVGDGTTLAAYRVADTDETADLLNLLVELRTAWLDRDDSLDVPER